MGGAKTAQADEETAGHVLPPSDAQLEGWARRDAEREQIAVEQRAILEELGPMPEDAMKAMDFDEVRPAPTVPRPTYLASNSVNQIDEPAKQIDLFKGPPILLENPLPPTISSGLVNGVIGDFIEALAVANETPMELGIGMVLPVLGAVCQNKFTVEVERNYFEQLSIWMATAMEPGNRKTSVYMSAIHPLILWEREQGTEMEDAIKAAESVVKTAKARIESLRAKAAKAEPGQYQSLVEEIQKLENEMPVVPTKPRAFADDITSEHAGTLMSANGGSMAFVADEGGVINTIAGRYNQGIANTDIFNKGFSGSAVRVDRGNRPSVFIDRPAVTFGLCPQPIIFQQIANNEVMKHGGFLDRFILMMPITKMGYRKLEQHPVPADISGAYQKIILDLANVKLLVDENGEEGPHTLTLSSDAWTLWKEWQREVETMLRESGRLSHMRGWGGKIAGTTARIAGLLHCGEFSFRAVAQSEIQADTMRRAVALAKVFTDHAVIVFDMMGADPATDAATALWKVIQKRRAEEFSARDAWHPLRGKYKRVADVEGGFQKLCDHNLIAELHTAETNKAGRPSRMFRVHPDIAGAWK